MTKTFRDIFDSNLPEINWTIQPVPQDFTIAVVYEQPNSTHYGVNCVLRS